LKKICLLFILINAISNFAFAQQESSSNGLMVKNGNLSSSIDSQNSEQSAIIDLENQPWKNSVFIATTYG
jgi:hypothetical protein